MKELTERQQQILQFISDYTEENSFPPTVRETAEHFSVSLKAIQDVEYRYTPALKTAF